LASAVGVILRGLERRFSFFGRIAISLIGMTWSVAAVFVIPVLIRETATNSPIEIMKKSAGTLKKVWGESLIGFAGVTIGGLYLWIFSLAWMGGGFYVAYGFAMWWLLPLVAGSWLVIVVVLSYLGGVASQIFRCALFLYATEGALPAPYNEEMVAMAWKRSDD
jgi:hypothetical protein